MTEKQTIYMKLSCLLIKGISCFSKSFDVFISTYFNVFVISLMPFEKFYMKYLKCCSADLSYILIDISQEHAHGSIPNT